MSLVPFTFTNVELKIVFIDSKAWARAKEVCRALEYRKKTGDVIKAHCSCENIIQKYELSSVTTAGTPVNWPKDSQKYDLYINEEGMYELIFSSQQPLAKEFRKYCYNVMFPLIRQKMVENLRIEHQLAIEEKDAALALLSDDLQDRDNRIQAIEYENIGLQGEIRAYQEQLQRSQNRVTELSERHVDHARNPGLDNIVIIIRKHTKPENDKYHHYPYYISRIQRRNRFVKLHWLGHHFPNHEIIVELDSPNAIHKFNRFEEEGHIERQYNHFSLIDLTRDDLYIQGIPGIIDD